jgi:biopolymer transport protein ExbD
LIEADYNAKHGSIIQVIDAGISAGMTNIRKTSRQDE